jgi:biopolymer transport protein ExbD
MRVTILSAVLPLLVISSTAIQAGMPVESSIYCQIPAHQTYDGRYAGGTVDLQILIDGKVLWGGTGPLDQKTFAEYLSLAAKEKTQPIFNVTAEPDTKFSILMPVLLQLQNGGIKTVMIGNTFLGIPARTK